MTGGEIGDRRIDEKAYVWYNKYKPFKRSLLASSRGRWVKIMRIMKKESKLRIWKVFFGIFFIVLGIFTGLVNNVYADPVITTPTATKTDGTTAETTTAETTTTETSESEAGDCYDNLGALGWLVCPSTGKIAEAVDWLYDKIEGVLEIKPTEMKSGSPIYEVWKYCRGITNILFIIFLTIIIYSQITGMGINNYGVKKSLPKLIVAAILVNLSFLICQVLVDVSNIFGDGIREIFANVAESAATSSGLSVELTFSNVVEGILAGATVIGGTAIAIEFGAIWMLIPTVLGAIVAVITGLVTIAMRQAVVMLLIMISPLAFVAYILPNTENLFKKWKNLLTQMLVFYPMFSALFGASNLAGFAIIMSADNVFMVLIGIAVQIFPLFFSWKMMKMSGTFLGGINSWMNGLASKPLATNRAWASSHQANKRANFMAKSTMPSAKLMRYLDYRKGLRETDTANAGKILAGKTVERVQRTIGNGIEIGEATGKSKTTSRYTRTAKEANNYGMIAANATANTAHMLSNYGSYFKDGEKDKKLAAQAQKAFIDTGRAAYQKEIDDENDTNFLVGKYLEANKRNADGAPVDEVAYNRYIKSVAGNTGEERIIAKVISQAAKVESKQRAEFAILEAKYGHNGYNKAEFRSWISGYKVNDDGWAIDMNGNRLRDDNGKYIETVRGDILTKAPEKMVLYDKRDDYGIYYDMKDQDGKVVARIHRGKGADGLNYDDGAFIKEVLANNDIPIGDPINNVYGVLSGIKPGDIVTPQGENEIGLARYSTTIGRAMNNYKGDAVWAGAMFNTGIGNRQIKNAAQYAIWTLDSIKKTAKPGGINTQNPASVEYLRTILDPRNLEQIFTEADIATAININNEPLGGEEWETDENGNYVFDENGEVKHHSVENPTYQQRLNTIKRKFVFPALSKILPALERLRTSNTADNQKSGTASEFYDLLNMVEEQYIDNKDVPFDPLLVNQDLPSAAMAFRMRKHDKDGNLIYEKKKNKTNDEAYQDLRSLTEKLEDAFNRSSMPDELINEIFKLLDGRDEYARVLEYFDEQCNLYPNATMNEIQTWFDEMTTLIL